MNKRRNKRIRNEIGSNQLQNQKRRAIKGKRISKEKNKVKFEEKTQLNGPETQGPQRNFKEKLYPEILYVS